MSEQPDNLPVAFPPRVARAPRRGMPIAALVLAVLALGVALWQAFDGRSRLDAVQQEVARRLAAADASARETRLLADQAREGTRDAEARLGQLEARLVETQNQRMALESLYREMSSSRDEWALAEVEQILLIANQQLQLAGNVKAALIALEAADAKLARLDRPQLIALRRTLGQDIERLRTAPHVDAVGMSLRLDGIAAAVDRFPLAMDAHPATATPTPGVPQGFWKRLWHETVRDLHDLVRIRDAQAPEVPLVSPAQAYFLRENLRLRLLGARLALLARDEAGFRADLKAASTWLARYYDVGDKDVIAAQTALRQLAQAPVSIEVPGIGASLEAARTLRLVRERTLR
jgi:uroporphyrin-3 C-methyltransferase